MSSTRNDPEGDFQGLIPRYIPTSVFGGEEAPVIAPLSRAVRSVEAATFQGPEVLQTAPDPPATPETTRTHLAAARAALAAMKSPSSL